MPVVPMKVGGKNVNVVVSKSNKLTPEEMIVEETRERNILLEGANEKVDYAIEAGQWSLYKFWALLAAILCGIIGSFLVIYGLSLTILFNGHPKNYIMAGFGGSLYIPSLYAFYLFCCPSKAERERRNRIAEQDKIRKKKSLYDDMMRAAADQRKDENPPSLIRVVGVLRNSRGFPWKEVPCLASTLQNFCEHMEEAVKIPVTRQVVVYKEKELHDLTLHLEHDYKVRRNDKLHVFNRGKYLTEIELNFNLRRTKEIAEDMELLEGGEGHDEEKEGEPLRPSFFADTPRKSSVNNKMSVGDANRRASEANRKTSVASSTGGGGGGSRVSRSNSSQATTKVAWRD